MKLAKSAILASAAGMIASGMASAADLGVKKPSAVDYVRTCPSYGAGFFVVPGTTSCLKMIGRVRFDYGVFADPRTRATTMNTMRARGFIGFDHRTATEYGMLRTFALLRMNRDNANAMTVELEQAGIQFGGLTVGRYTPVFETSYYWTMGGRASGNGGIGGSSDLLYHNQASYTFQFGKAFSATVALANAAERMTPIIGGGAYAGQAMPDIVGRLDYKESWGEVMVAGVLHQVRHTTPTVDTRYGWAATAGAKLLLPFLSKGSNLFVMASYAEGANSYTGFNNINIGQAAIATADAILAGGATRLSKTWGVVGGLQAYVTPKVWLGVTGAYASYNPFGGSNTVSTAWVASNVGWVPAEGLLIGGELEYRAIVNSSVGAGHAQLAAGTDKSSIVGRVRVQRNF